MRPVPTSLVLDDDGPTRATVVASLEDAGMRVRVAADGRDGLVGIDEPPEPARVRTVRGVGYLLETGLTGRS